jgi:hypothetical protein
VDNLRSDALAAWNKLLGARKEAGTGAVADKNSLPAAMSVLVAKLSERFQLNMSVP